MKTILFVFIISCTAWQTTNAQGNGTSPGSSPPPPLNGTSPAPMNGTAPPPMNGTSPPPMNGTSPPPMNGTSPPPMNGTVPPPMNGTAPPPMNGTSPPPMNGTAPPPMSPSPNGTTNAPPPGSCPNAFCPEPGSVCRVSPCPPRMQYCCVCPPGRLGDKCEKARQAVARQTMKLNQPFNASLSDTTSAYFAAMETTLCELAKPIWENGYKNKNQSVSVGCKCSGMTSGSIVANLTMDLASNDSSSATIAPLSQTELQTAMTQTCSANSSCASAGLDTTYVSVATNLDLCSSSTLNNCSQYATCTFYSGLNYTCACKNGYKDDYNSLGYTCTRLCSPNPCGGGTCTQNIGADVTCSNCPAGTSGKYCSGGYQVQQSLAVLLISFLMMALFRMNS